MEDKSIIDIFSKIFGIMNLLLIFVSLIFNSLVLFICLRSKKLRSISTFKLLAFGSINDMIACFAWNFEDFLASFYTWQPYYNSLFYCRWISILLQCSSLNLISWLLVSVSFDRFLTLTIKKWSNIYFTGYRPIIFASILACFILSIYFNEIFTIGVVLNVNGTETILCYVSAFPEIDWNYINSKISLYFGFLLPYVLLITINFSIVYKATRFERTRRHSVSECSDTIRSTRKKAEMTRSILIITFLYVFMTAPSILVDAYFFDSLIEIDLGVLVIDLIDLIHFSYPAFNFFILYFSNKVFCQQVKNCFARMKQNQVGFSENPRASTI